MTSLRRAIPGKQNLGLFVYRGKKKDTYFVRREAAGRTPLEKKLKSQTLNDARREAQELVQEWAGLKPKTVVIQLTKELWAEWVKTKADKSQGTQDSIGFSGKHLMAILGDYLPSEINSQLWEKYIQLKREEKPTRRFFNEWKWLNMFLIYLHDNGLIEKRPRLRNPDPKDKPGRTLTEDEIITLMSNAGPWDLHLQILMSYELGTRDQENKCLYWVPEFGGKPRSYVDLKNRSIVLRAEDTKIRRGRTVPLTQRVYEELLARKEKALGAAVFPSDNNPNERQHRQSTKGAWLRCRQKSGIKCRFHDIRHSYLTRAFNMARGKVDSMLICTAAGLSIEEAQRTYLHFTVDDLRPVSDLIGDGSRENGGKNV